MVTFNVPDYICIAPFAWGRANSAREAYRIAKGNMPGKTYVPDPSKAKIGIWRLSDAVDTVEVNDFGGFTMPLASAEVNRDDVQARLVYMGMADIPASRIAEHLIEEVEPLK